MSEPIELSPCASCGESGSLVSWEGKHYIRPYRITRCKNRKTALCTTEVHPTPEEAAKEWRQITARQPEAGDGGR